MAFKSSRQRKAFYAKQGAKWKGQWYKREESGKWRNGNDGQIGIMKNGKIVGTGKFEANRQHIYGPDTAGEKAGLFNKKQIQRMEE